MGEKAGFAFIFFFQPHKMYVSVLTLTLVHVFRESGTWEQQYKGCGRAQLPDKPTETLSVSRQ